MASKRGAAGRPRMSATSRDPEAWARATKAAREQRELTAAECAVVVAAAAQELIVAGDVMAGRAVVVQRVTQLAAAERTGDTALVRAAVMDLCAAAGAWVAALDFRAPEDYASPAKSSPAI